MPTPYPERPPWFTVQWLPESERAIADHINLLIHVIEIHRWGFRAALQLFDHSDTLFRDSMAQPDRGVDPSRLDFGQWSFIAARSAVMEIYHFGITMDSIRGQIGLCKSLMPLVNTGLLKEAKKQFQKRFPRAERMRHAVGHIAEMMSSPELMNFNFQNANSDGWLITHMNNRSFEIRYRGERLSVDVSAENLDLLTNVELMLFSALKPAADSTSPSPSRPASPPAPDQTGHQ